MLRRVNAPSRFVFAGLLSLLAAEPASATGGFGCEVDDANVRFTLNAMTTRGMGFPIQRVDGDIEIRSSGLSDDLRVTRFEDWSLPQYWTEDNELRLFAYRERMDTGPFGSVKLIVRTRFETEDAAELTGRYDLEIVDMRMGGGGADMPIRLEGPVTCMLE